MILVRLVGAGDRPYIGVSCRQSADEVCHWTRVTLGESTGKDDNLIVLLYNRYFFSILRNHST